MMRDVIEQFTHRQGPTTFEFEGLVIVDYLEGNIDCIVNSNKDWINKNSINLAEVFEFFFKDRNGQRSQISGEFDNIHITISQRP
jgi:hypothetical protein